MGPSSNQGAGASASRLGRLPRERRATDPEVNTDAGVPYLAIPRNVMRSRSKSTICWLDRRPTLAWTLLLRTVVSLSNMMSLS